MKAIISAVVLVLLSLGCVMQQGNRDSFGSIRQLVCDGQYEKAIPKLKAYQGRHASRAGLFLGKAYLALGDLKMARQAFEDTVRKFPKTLEGHKCRYKLAMVTLARRRCRFRPGAVRSA